MKERLDWIEKAGIENMKAHHTSADVLAKEAATSLTVLLAGVGGGLAYAAKAVDSNSWTWLSAGTAAFTLWLVVLSWYLVTKCLMLEPIPQIYNEPKNLDLPNEELDFVRQCELLSLQQRIEQASKRNALLASRLNLTRKLAVASPLVFILVSAGYAMGAKFLAAAY